MGDKTLPAWPDIGPCRPGWYAYPEIDEAIKPRIHAYMVENSAVGEWYHKDAYLAAMARLRVAVECMTDVQRILVDRDIAHREAVGMYNTLVAIGPLPPDPTEGG